MANRNGRYWKPYFLILGHNYSMHSGNNLIGGWAGGTIMQYSIGLHRHTA